MRENGGLKVDVRVGVTAVGRIYYIHRVRNELCIRGSLGV